ncbi:MAG TPA: hypothetical protein VH640_18155, partial [Bryobacteraceae bacterium]
MRSFSAAPGAGCHRTPVIESRNIRGHGRRTRMNRRFLYAVAVSAAWLLLMAQHVSMAQSNAAASGASTGKSQSYVPPKTPWGEPDLQGSWPAQFNIPRERPASVKDNALSDEALTQKQAQTSKQFQARQQNHGNNGIGPPANWGEIGKAARQTSQ